MVSITRGHVIVDEEDNILLFTARESIGAAWRALLLLGEWHHLSLTKKAYQKMGFKCVPMEITTGEYKR